MRDNLYKIFMPGKCPVHFPRFWAFLSETHGCQAQHIREQYHAMFTLFLKRSLSKPDIPAQDGSNIISAPRPHTGTGLDVYAGEDAGEYAITRYPPFDKGIPAVDPAKLMRAQADLLERIRRSAGVTRVEFEAHYRKPMENLAWYVHLLPATSTTYFRGTGGLFRMSVEIALNSLQAANAAVFPTGGNVERRHVLLPRWTLASFLGGLCSQCYRTINTLSVLTRDNAQWQPLLGSLHAWIQEKAADVYFVRWLDEQSIQGEQATAAYAISKIIPANVLQYLSDGNNQVVQAMTAAVAGADIHMSENPIARLVAPVITRVIEADLKQSATHYGHLVIGAHLEPHLLDAMRRLVKQGQWVANSQASGGRLWCGGDGVYIDWIPASRDIAGVLARDAFAGVPKDPDTLADLLARARLLQLNRGNEKYWSITMPETFELKEGFVKLADKATLFPPGYDMKQFDGISLGMGAKWRKPAPPSIPDSRDEQMPRPGEIKERADRAVPEPKEPSREQAELFSDEQPLEPDISQPDESEDEKAAVPGRKASRLPKPDAKPMPEARQDLRAESPKRADREMTVETLLASLKKPNALLLSEIIRAKKEGTLTGKVIRVSGGIGITPEELSNHGIPSMELMQELSMKGWLHVDPKKPSRTIHAVEENGESLRVLVIRPEFAEILGLGN
jgi:conjugal transfer pilus assembly protein TraI